MNKKSKDLSTKIVFSTYYTVHPEDRQKFIDAVVPHLEYTQKQEGCIYYEFAADLLDPNTIHLSEGWADEEALAVHHSSEPFKTGSPPSWKVSGFSITRDSVTRSPIRAPGTLPAVWRSPDPRHPQPDSPEKRFCL